jgi:hypothetical protein
VCVVSVQYSPGDSGRGGGSGSIRT